MPSKKVQKTEVFFFFDYFPLKKSTEMIVSQY